MFYYIRTGRFCKVAGNLYKAAGKSCNAAGPLCKTWIQQNEKAEPKCQATENYCNEEGTG
ncbi:MAG TPA: hypothetical protein VJY62_10680 [Bacteroidia bacterium]|nr:hypothetical protein [Bacteroidia bacterium]